MTLKVVCGVDLGMELEINLQQVVGIAARSQIVANPALIAIFMIIDERFWY